MRTNGGGPKSGRPNGLGYIADLWLPRVDRPLSDRQPVTATEAGAADLAKDQGTIAEQQERAARTELELNKPPIDAFSMQAGLRYLPGRYYPLALSDFDYLRRNKDQYRCRMVSIPRDNQTEIPFNQGLEFQVKIPTGSWFWGLIFANITGELTDFRVDLVFNCGDRPLWSQTIRAEALQPNGTTGLRPVIFKPVLMEGEAQLNARITNMDTANNRRGQLLLMFADPCTLLSTDIEQVEMV
jgi:hypothetical protein